MQLKYITNYIMNYCKFCNKTKTTCVCYCCVVQTSGLSAEVNASSSADLAEIEQIVKERMVNFESENFCVVDLSCRLTCIS